MRSSPKYLLIGLSFIVLSFPLSLVSVADDQGKAAPANATRVVISCEEDVGQDHDDYYYSRLLDLALSKSAPRFGPYEIAYTPVMPINKRLLRQIERGSVDVTWMPYRRDLNYDLVPIKIRLLKNLSDYRVFLIRAEDREKFVAVKTIDDLRKFKGGIGSHWADRHVMEENGLPLVLSMSYFNLFKMLKSGRFDYFSRGVYQVRAELQKHSPAGIALEPHVLLSYENPVYFYVHKNNRQLAERLETGLKIALEDGSFEQLFNEVDNLHWGQKLLQQNDRVVIPLYTTNGQ